MQRTMTPQQTATAYQLAVKSSLLDFYEKSEGEADRPVSAWWHRISKNDESKSGEYLHTEALGTATDLAHVNEIKITPQIRARYVEILQKSSERALGVVPMPMKKSRPSAQHRVLTRAAG